MKPLLGKDYPGYADVIFDKRPEQLSIDDFVRLTKMTDAYLRSKEGNVEQILNH